MQSVNRALDVLFSIASADGPLSASSLSKQLDLPRPTVYRILGTLEGRGVITRIDEGSVVTPKLGLLMGGAGNTAKLADFVRPRLHNLVSVTQETSSLHIRIGDMRRCVAEVEGYHGIRWARGAGFTAPVWSGAVGHVILAGLPAAELHELLGRVEFVPLASKMLTSAAQLRKSADKARRQGWSSSVSQTVEGAAAVAAPMLDDKGSTVAVMALYASADRYELIQEFLPQLLESATGAAAEWTRLTTIEPEVIEGE